MGRAYGGWIRFSSRDSNGGGKWEGRKRDALAREEIGGKSEGQVEGKESQVEGKESQMMSKRTDPWIETRQGGLFFVNALLVAPALVVLFPLTVGALVTVLAPDRPASPFLDTIPFVASKSLPYLGWFLVIPIWTTIRNLRIETLVLPRVALGLFLVLHISFLGYTVLSWMG